MIKKASIKESDKRERSDDGGGLCDVTGDKGDKV